MTSADDVEAAANEAVAKLGKIDVLLASTGITGPNETAWECPLRAWRDDGR
ncbi:hypothetical protein [Bradyrhizobium sp. USDA 4503]